MPRAAGVAAAVSLVAMLTYEVFLPWNDSIAVPDITHEQWMAMSFEEQEGFLRDRSTSVKSLRGAEKYLYAVHAQPFIYLYRWFVWFLPCFIAVIVAGLMERRKRET